MIISRKYMLNFVRNCARNKATQHPYANKNYTPSEVANVLINKIIYNKDGIVVFNKPQGISFSEQTSKSTNDLEISLQSILPFLKKKLNYSTLRTIKVPERYASGVAVFCTDEDLHKRISKCLSTMRGTKIPAEVYECVVIGAPVRNYGTFDGGITLETKSSVERVKLIQESYKSHIRQGKVKPVLIEHSTIASNEFASWLSISTTRTKWHAVRAYATMQLVTPVLGDRVFGGFVKRVLGKSILVDLWSPAASQPLKLPEELLSKLHLLSRQDVEIPLHLHLVKVILNNFPTKGRVQEFIAPPPDFFKWTLSRLELSDEHFKKDLVQVRK